jgi:hypothetical protein
MAIDSDLLVLRLNALFDDGGKPNPALKKCLSHFKDRFKEVTETIRGRLLAKAGKPSTVTETTPSGSRVLLTVKFTDAVGTNTLQRERQIPVEALNDGGLPIRLVTPTMKAQGAKLSRDPAEGVGPGWGQLLSREVGPLVSVDLTGERGEYTLRAAFLFHHPEDDAASRASTAVATEEPLPADEARWFRGGVLLIKGVNLRLVDTAHGYVGAKGSGHPNVSIRAVDKYDAGVKSLIEAASSKSASYEGLKSLAKRLNLDLSGERLSWVVLDNRMPDLTKALANIASLIKSIPRDALQAVAPPGERPEETPTGWALPLDPAGRVTASWEWDILKGEPACCGSWTTLYYPSWEGSKQLSGKGAELLGSRRINVLDLPELLAWAEEVKESMIGDLKRMMGAR